MYKRVKKNLSQPCEKVSGWDRLITEARQQIKDLEKAIEHFEQNKVKGEPYFGEQGVRKGKGATDPPQ